MPKYEENEIKHNCRAKVEVEYQIKAPFHSLPPYHCVLVCNEPPHPFRSSGEGRGHDFNFTLSFSLRSSLLASRFPSLHKAVCFRCLFIGQGMLVLFYFYLTENIP